MTSLFPTVGVWKAIGGGGWKRRKKKYLFVWHCCKITLGSLGLAEIYTGSLFSEHFRGLQELSS